MAWAHRHRYDGWPHLTPTSTPPANMRTDDLDYHLPPQLLATTPATPRDAARLMVVRRDRDGPAHHHVRDLPALLAGPKISSEWRKTR